MRIPHRRNQVGATQKGGTGLARIGRQSLDVGQPRRIIDRHVDTFPADAADPCATIPMATVADPRDSPKPLEIDVQQITRIGILVAADKRGGSRHATRLRPARARMRVTVDRGMAGVGHTRGVGKQAGIHQRPRRVRRKIARGPTGGPASRASGDVRT